MAGSSALKVDGDIFILLFSWLVLIMLSMVEFIVIFGSIAYNPILFLSSISIIQAVIIAFVFQHLKSEPSSIRAFPFSSLVLLIVLISAAVTSVLACTPYLG